MCCLAVSYTHLDVYKRQHMEMSVNFDQHFGIETKSVLRHFEWIKDPVLHLGELNIPKMCIRDSLYCP